MSAEIVIVLYNNPVVEARCIESVQKHTNLEEHKLTIIDNFTLDANLGAVWNRAIQNSDREFIMLLNSDTIVEAGWLDNLVKVAQEHNADAVGPVSNHVGVSTQKQERSDKISAVAQLSGFCLLLRKSSWADAKGFREAFPFYGQESNLMLRLKKKLVNHSVFIHHDAGSSVNASGRKEEEREISKEFWPRDTGFNWKQRIAILGLGPGVKGPLWSGIDQSIVEFDREGCAVEHFDLSKVSNFELRSFKPSCVIVCSGTKLDRLSEVLRGVRVPRGFWLNDLRGATEARAERFKGLFTHLFLCFGDSPTARWSEWQEKTKAKPFYMPQGCKIVTELAPLDIQRELVFIGDVTDPRFHGDRKAVVEQLGATVLNAATKSPERLRIEMNSRQTYRQSRFCLSLSPKVNGYTSLRTYNIMAYGGLALLREFPGREKLFTEKHCVPWKTVDDAKLILHQFLPEAEVIRKRAWRHVQARHTGMRRIQNMVANMTTDDKSFWGFLS